ncbi:hypothetical protein [Polaribacter sp. SA4-12]|uniref:hypothetical protein n=1 Tax=Polaribacter sp. SA4-12 TaxID=1312072 RepID=UPI000B3C2DC5|nr:hypothetical protein [Polaribacter sp. SA4-12]ARV15058.1 hypothetical protein BTO07_07790 [Polaribacter sp. SA4-12]
MEEILIYNSNMHFEHLQWKEELSFWNDELKFFNDKINELIKRGANKNVLAKLAHYQNEFILHITIMGIIHGGIEELEIKIATQSEENTSAFDKKMIKIHGDFRVKFKRQRKVYSNLKKSFFRFIKIYM